MTGGTALAAAIRPGFSTVTPYLSVRRAATLVDFLVVAFDAEPTYRSPSGHHFEVRIGDSMVMVGDVGDGTPSTGQLLVYVPDAEALHDRALAAGASSFLDPADRAWGEDETMMRGCAVQDPAGNVWFLAGPK